MPLSTQCPLGLHKGYSLGATEYTIVGCWLSTRSMYTRFPLGSHRVHKGYSLGATEYTIIGCPLGQCPLGSHRVHKGYSLGATEYTIVGCPLGQCPLGSHRVHKGYSLGATEYTHTQGTTQWVPTGYTSLGATEYTHTQGTHWLSIRNFTHMGIPITCMFTLHGCHRVTSGYIFYTMGVNNKISYLCCVVI